VGDPQKPFSDAALTRQLITVASHCAAQITSIAAMNALLCGAEGDKWLRRDITAHYGRDEAAILCHIAGGTEAICKRRTA
jgi:hypothetical protein